MARLPGQRGSLEPWIKDDVIFYKHQVEGVAWLKQRSSALLADDMGMGKSIQTLATFGMHLWELEKKYPGMEKSGRMLVVCPTNLKENWENEILEFTRFNYVLLEGNNDQRLKQILKFWAMPDPKILIVNYEQVKPHIRQLNMLDFTIIAADEAHNLKNPDAVRAKAFGALRARRKIMLTGTPIENNPAEMWFALDQISPGQWGTFWQFRNDFCVLGGYGGKAVVGAKNTERLRLKLSDVMLRRHKKDHLDLPEVQIIKRYVKLTENQKGLYNQIVEDEEFPSLETGEMEDLSNPLVKFLRLKQICATTATVLGLDKDESSKLDLATDDAELICSSGEKLVVFTQFRSVLECYRRRLEQRLGHTVPIYELHGGIPKQERFGVVKTWGSQPGAAIIMGTLKVMSEGLNMTQARHGQFIDKHFNPAKNSQAIDRMNRIGASLTQPVQIYEYIVRNSAEMRVENILKGKKGMSDQILDPNGMDILFTQELYDAITQKMD